VRLLYAVSAAGLVAFGLLCANAWIANAWAASGPPSPRPEWHRVWSARFFWIMLASFGLAAILLVRRARVGRGAA
jgi:hypothetical protein